MPKWEITSLNKINHDKLHNMGIAEYNFEKNSRINKI
jgi:hypothetical protein